MSIAEAVPINWAIIRNPINWATFFFMILIAGFALHVVLNAAKPLGASNNNG